MTQYSSIPSIQTPHLSEGGLITSWTLRLSITDGTFISSIEHEYVCEPEECLVEGDPNTSSILQSILDKVDLYSQCKKTLDEKINGHQA